MYTFCLSENNCTEIDILITSRIFTQIIEVLGVNWNQQEKEKKNTHLKKEIQRAIGWT